MKRLLFLVLLLSAPGLIGFWAVQEISASGPMIYDQADLEVINHPDIFKWKWSKRAKVEETMPVPTPKVEEPMPVREAPPSEWKPMPEKMVYFDYDKSVLKPEAKAAIQKNVQYLREKPNARLLVEGHCDERGTNEYNLALGERRAEAVKNYMIDLGINGSRITTKSWGEEKSVEMGHNEAAWSKNRRAEMFFAE